MPEKTTPRLVKGGRPSTCPKKPSGLTDRIRFVPRESGLVDVYLVETGYAITLQMPVEVTVPREAWGYEHIGD